MNKNKNPKPQNKIIEKARPSMFWIFHLVKEKGNYNSWRGKGRKPGKQVVALQHKTTTTKKQLRSCQEGWVSVVIVVVDVAAVDAGHAQKRDGNIYSEKRAAVFVDFRMFRMHKQSKSAWSTPERGKWGATLWRAWHWTRPGETDRRRILIMWLPIDNDNSFQSLLFPRQPTNDTT